MKNLKKDPFNPWAPWTLGHLDPGPLDPGAQGLAVLPSRIQRRSQFEGVKPEPPNDGLSDTVD